MAANGGWIGGVTCQALKVNDETSRLRSTATDIANLRGFASRGGSGPPQVSIEAWLEDTAKDERAAALANVLRLTAPVIVQNAGGDTWEGHDGIVVQLDGRIQKQAAKDLTRVEFDAVIVGIPGDTLWDARTRSVIQTNDFSETGVTRLALPGEGATTSGGGTTRSELKAVDDPDAFAGVAYEAEKILTNFTDLSRAKATAADWQRLQPFLIDTGLPLDADQLASGDPADLSATTAKWVLIRAPFSWDGVTYDTDDQFGVEYNDSTTSRYGAAVPLIEASGSDETWYAAWIDKATGVDQASWVGAGGTGITRNDLEAWDLGAHWSLGDGPRYTDFVAGYGAAQAYIRDEKILATTSPLDGDGQPVSVLLDSSPSWWRLNRVTPDYVSIETDAEDEVRLWRSGLVEVAPSTTTFRVRPADTSLVSGTYSWRPHSTRDARITSLENYSASIASETATVTGTSTGQRYGVDTLVGSIPLVGVVRRTRTTWVRRP